MGKGEPCYNNTWKDDGYSQGEHQHFVSIMPRAQPQALWPNDNGHNSRELLSLVSSYQIAKPFFNTKNLYEYTTKETFKVYLWIHP